FLIRERWHHARTFDLYRLVEEDNDETGNRQRDHQVPQPDRERHRARGSCYGGLGGNDAGVDWLFESGHVFNDSIRMEALWRRFRVTEGLRGYNGYSIRVTISEPRIWDYV